MMTEKTKSKALHTWILKYFSEPRNERILKALNTLFKESEQQRAVLRT